MAALQNLQAQVVSGKNTKRQTKHKSKPPFDLLEIMVHDDSTSFLVVVLSTLFA